MAYRVIYCEEFTKYRVKRQHPKIKLVLAWCQVSGEEMYCVNVIQSSSSMSDLLRFVKLCKEKNEEHTKKISDKENSRLFSNTGCKAPQQNGE